MADTGINWGALTHATFDVGTPFDEESIADEGDETSDEIDLDGYAACEVSVVATEPNTAGPDGDIVVYLLRSDNDPDSEGWQTIDDARQWARINLDTQNTTRKTAFTVDPASVSSFKVHIYNDTGVSIDVTVNYRLGQIPAAS